jgi:hypothetical protein
MANNLDSAITVYNNKYADVATSNIEFELKFKDIDVRMFSKIGEKLHADVAPVLECTINIIANNIYERGKTSNDTSYIRTMTFTKDVKTRDIYSTKTRLMRPIHINEFPKYSVGIAEETPIKSFGVPPTALIRIKLRNSYIIDKWRIDLTAVKQMNMSDVKDQLLEIKKRIILPTLTAENFFTTIPHEEISQYEIEAEWIGDKLIREDVDSIVLKLKDLFATSTSNDNSEYHSSIYEVAKLIIDNKHIINKFKTEFGLKRLLNQVVALSKNTYREIYPPIGYYLTDKADGTRACAYVANGMLTIISSDIRKFAFGTDSSTDSSTGGSTDGSTASTIICDCELLNDKLLVFDCMWFEKSLCDLDYATRFTYIDAAVKIINTIMPCARKNIIIVSDNLKESFDAIYRAPRDYTIDGLILTEPGKNYKSTRNYKWKPIENNTIDFLAVRCPQSLLGKAPYIDAPGKQLYLLFVGIDHTMRTKLNLTLIQDYRKLFDPPGEYYPVQFSPSIDKYAYLYQHSGEDINYKVIELCKQTKDKKSTIGEWSFVRVRTDRSNEKNYFGNDFKIAELTYMNYIDVFTYNDLIIPSGGYFAYTSSDTYMAANRYKRFVISLLIKNNLSGVKWVIDLAAGRGGDLHRYQEVGVGDTLFIDVDSSAIVELIRRKFDMFNIKRRRMQQWGTSTVTEHAMTVHTLVRDLRDNYKDIIADTSRVVLPNTVNGIVCNFAIHYFCDTTQNIRNLLTYVSKMLTVGGVFIFTTLDGRRVFNKLSKIPKDGQYELSDQSASAVNGSSDNTNNELEIADYIHGGADAKYIIKKMYTADKLAPVGQKIGVRLPFADELREEPLANIDMIISECGTLGMEVELNEPFDIYLKQFENADKDLYSRLTGSDIEYISLHQFVSVRKIK